MTRLALLATLLLTSCGGSTSPAPTLPDCSPGSVDVELVSAPADREFPTCVEIPAYRPLGSTARAWCCWKGTVER